MTDKEREILETISSHYVDPMGCLGSLGKLEGVCPMGAFNLLIESMPLGDVQDQLVMAGYDDGRSCPAPYLQYKARKLLGPIKESNA